jgi:hypothetical protein
MKMTEDEGRKEGDLVRRGPLLMRMLLRVRMLWMRLLLRLPMIVVTTVG